MSDMTGHAKPPARRDHLWVLFIIAACCLIEVWTSWVTIGSMSGFPKLFGKISTDWTLAVTTEAYWAYALFAWLGAAPGPKSRRFAMWSAAVVFAMSLTGQGAAHLVRPGQQPSGALVVFVSALPVIVLASIAILIHFRQADREDAQRARAEREEAGERAVLRTELAAVREQHEGIVSALRDELAEARAALENAHGDVAEALTRAEKAERKLTGATAQKRGRKTGRNPQGGDLTTELRAVQMLDANPELRKPRMGGELARRLGVSPATGRRLHSQLTAQDAPAESLSERSE